VYIGKFQICEARPFGGVQLAMLFDRYVGDSELRFRRDESLTTDRERYDIVVQALSRLQKPYGFSRILSLWRSSKRGHWRHPVASFGEARSTICSQLYADAYTLATERLLLQTETGIPTPADLSLTPRLIDVKVNWLKIEK
jgi:hypothetical protein